LFIRTERRRTSAITVFAICGGVERWLKIPIPGDIARRSVAEAIERTREQSR